MILVCMGTDTLLTRFVLQEMQLEGVAAYQEEDGLRNMTEEELSEPSSSTPHDTVGLTPDPV